MKRQAHEEFMKPTWNKILLLLTILATVSSCATFGRKNSGPAYDPNSIVVQRSGQASPIITTHNRQFWVNLRQNSDDDATRLYATLATGEWEAAEHEARKYLRQKPRSRAGLIVLTSALSLGKKFQLAAYYAKELEKQFPNDADALNVQALAVLMQPQNRIQDFRQAIELLERAVAADGRQIAAALNLANLQLMLGDSNAAASSFALAKTRCNNCRDALIGSGTANSRSGQYAQAKKDFQQVLSKDKNDQDALYRLALVENNGYNNRDQASKLLNQLLADRSASNLLRERANVLLRRIEGRSDRYYGVGSLANQRTSDNEVDVMFTTLEQDIE